MAKVRTFTSQLKIFQAKRQLEELDREVNDFIQSQNVNRVISVSDTSTTGSEGEAIGLIRVVAYEP